jgi:hypothetical protein
MTMDNSTAKCTQNRGNKVNVVGIKRMRAQRGSVIVEGVVGTWLVISALVCSVLLLVNTGLATYYKQRLGFITDQVSTLAANEIASPMFVSTDQTIANTKERAKKLLHDLGMPAPQSVDVVVDPPQSPPTSTNPPSTEETTVKVTIRIFGLQMIGNGTVIPSVLALQDSSETIIDNTRPRYAANILEETSQVGGGVGVGITVPAYGGYSCAHGSFFNYTVRGPKKVYYSLDNKFGDGTIAAPGGGNLFNTNWQAPGNCNYPNVAAAQGKLFQVEGTLP